MDKGERDIHLTALRPYIGKCVEYMGQFVRWKILRLMVSTVNCPCRIHSEISAQKVGQWPLHVCVRMKILPVDEIRHSSVAGMSLLLHVNATVYWTERRAPETVTWV